MSTTPQTITLVVPRSRERRVVIDAHGEALLETSRDVVSVVGIEDGSEWDLAELRRRIEDAEPQIARERALLLLGHSERTRLQLQQRLEREGLSQNAVSGVLDRLEEVGAVSDERYADCFTRSKTIAGWGRPRISRALVEKGVSDDLIASVLDEYAPAESEADRARTVIASRPLSTPRERDRALARLARKGFAPSDALSALRTEADLHS